MPECDLPFEECSDPNCLHSEARLLHDEHQAKIAARNEAKRSRGASPMDLDDAVPIVAPPEDAMVLLAASDDEYASGSEDDAEVSVRQALEQARTKHAQR